MQNEGNLILPQCYVVVRKFTMEEISRMIVNPLYIAHKCGQCLKSVCHGPQCRACQTFYHYDCTIKRITCCERSILPCEGEGFPTKCLKCKRVVKFGPQCSICKSKFHSYCISPYEQCCQLNLYEYKQVPRQCRKCSCPVEFGPKCPQCKTMYHISCVGEMLECCRIKFAKDDNINCKCKKCHRKLAFGSPMCVFCGTLLHAHCYKGIKKCCKKPLSLEVYFIPNFKFTTNYFTQFDRRRAALRRLDEVVVSHTHELRSAKTNSPSKRAKKKNVSSQTNALDSITILEVKTELEPKEVDIPQSPPVLEREDTTPEPSEQFPLVVPESSVVVSESCVDTDDSLRNLFDFLYNMVKKFPPGLQTQVKIDLFKTVTEAEMKWQCNVLQNNCL